MFFFCFFICDFFPVIFSETFSCDFLSDHRAAKPRPRMNLSNLDPERESPALKCNCYPCYLCYLRVTKMKFLKVKHIYTSNTLPINNVLLYSVFQTFHRKKRQFSLH